MDKVTRQDVKTKTLCAGVFALVICAGWVATIIAAILSHDATSALGAPLDGQVIGAVALLLIGCGLVKAGWGM